MNRASTSIFVAAVALFCALGLVALVFPSTVGYVVPALAPVLFLGFAIGAGVELFFRWREDRKDRIRTVKAEEKDVTAEPRAEGAARDGGEYARDAGFGVDYRLYPVTGSYDPEKYRERGGRHTAQSMQTWGIEHYEDYEDIRANLED